MRALILVWHQCARRTLHLSTHLWRNSDPSQWHLAIKRLAGLRAQFVPGATDTATVQCVHRTVQPRPRRTTLVTSSCDSEAVNRPKRTPHRSRQNILRTLAVRRASRVGVTPVKSAH